MKSFLSLCSIPLAGCVGAGLLSLASPASASAQMTLPPCALRSEDAAWIQSTLESWEEVQGYELGLAAGALPWLVLFDASCAWHVNPDAALLPDPDWAAAATLHHGGRPVVVLGTPFAETIRLPDGEEIPPRLMSFASTYGAEGKPYLVMAMPAIWRAEPRHREDAHLDILIRSVFAHEMTHTLQARTFGARLDALGEHHGIAEELDDDIVQRRFGERPGFRAAYEAERDLLYRAVSEQDPQRRRGLAADALGAAVARRARYFTGEEAFFAELEDLFLNMEGVANWAAYRAAVRQGMSETDALALIRRGGRFWSQDAGLALFLLFDAVVPGWQTRAFAERPASVFEMLAEAAR